MLKKVRVADNGDTDMFPGSLVDMYGILKIKQWSNCWRKTSSKFLFLKTIKKKNFKILKKKTGIILFCIKNIKDIFITRIPKKLSS